MKYFRLVAWSFLVIFMIGCNNQSSKTEAWTNPLVISISDLKGEFMPDAGNGTFDFSLKLSLDSLIQKYDQNTIPDTLVKYLDDTTLSKSVFQGKPVMTGVISFEALSLLIYYEPTDEKGDVAMKWPGFIRPDAGVAELKAAKEAWQKVLASNTFKRL